MAAILAMDSHAFIRRFTAGLLLLTLIVVVCAPATAEKFSIKCQREFTYFVTLDTETKRVVYEVVRGGMYKGGITRMRADKIDFWLGDVGVPPRELVCDAGKKSLAWLPGPPNSKTRLLLVDGCARVDLRDALSKYDYILPTRWIMGRQIVRVRLVLILKQWGKRRFGRSVTARQPPGRPPPSLVAGLLVLLGLGSTFAAPDELAEAIVMNTQRRPFPVFEFQLGDVPLVIPKDWIDSKFLSVSRGSTPFINVSNANYRRPPRSTHFEFPPLVLFAVTETAPGLPARNLRDSKAEWDRRGPERHPDQHGFWEWKRQEYVLVESRHARPFDQRLVVRCTGSLRPNRTNEHSCTVQFYWTLATGITYDFYDTDVPQSQWVDLDRHVIQLLQFLDGREPWRQQNPFSHG